MESDFLDGEKLQLEIFDPEEEINNRKLFHELRREASSTILSGYSYRSFVSNSAGRNKKTGKKKKRTEWVEIELIGIGGGRFISLTNGRPPKCKKTRMDSIAEEAVGDSCPPHIQPLEYFLSVLRGKELLSKKER